MPIIQSAIKRARQNTVRKDRLRPNLTYMRTMMRRMSDLVKEGKRDEAIKLMPSVYRAIDVAAKKRIIHRKNADNKKAGIAKLVAQK